MLAKITFFLKTISGPSLEWIKENFIHFYQISLKHQSFSILNNFLEKWVINNPELFLNSDDSKDIEEPLLISLLENDDLVVKEIDA